MPATEAEADEFLSSVQPASAPAASTATADEADAVLGELNKPQSEFVDQFKPISDRWAKIRAHSLNNETVYDKMARQFNEPILTEPSIGQPALEKMRTELEQQFGRMFPESDDRDKEYIVQHFAHRNDPAWIAQQYGEDTSTGKKARADVEAYVKAHPEEAYHPDPITRIVRPFAQHTFLDPIAQLRYSAQSGAPPVPISDVPDEYQARITPEVPAGTTPGEKTLDLLSNIGSFMSKMAIAKQAIPGLGPGVAQEAAAMEMVGRQEGSTYGAGAVMGLGFGVGGKLTQLAGGESIAGWGSNLPPAPVRQQLGEMLVGGASMAEIDHLLADQPDQQREATMFFLPFATRAVSWAMEAPERARAAANKEQLSRTAAAEIMGLSRDDPRITNPATRDAVLKIMQQVVKAGPGKTTIEVSKGGETARMAGDESQQFADFDKTQAPSAPAEGATPTTEEPARGQEESQTPQEKVQVAPQAGATATAAPENTSASAQPDLDESTGKLEWSEKMPEFGADLKTPPAAPLPDEKFTKTYAEGDLRYRMAQERNSMEIVRKAFEPAWKLANTMTPDEVTDFIDRFERRQKQASAELQDAADTIQKYHELYKDEIGKIDPERVFAWQDIADYIGRSFFKEGDKAGSWMRQWFEQHLQETRGKSFTGNPTAFMERSFDWYKDAIAAGFKPVSDNPIDIQLSKLAGMSKWLWANRYIEDFNGGQFTRTMDAPDGWRVPRGPGGDADPAFRKYGPRTKEGWFPLIGYKALPEAAARAVEAALSEGIGQKLSRMGQIGKGLAVGYDALRSVGGAGIRGMLALSGFHNTATAIMASVSDLDLALANPGSSRTAAGGALALTGAGSAIDNLLHSSRSFKEAYYKPEAERTPLQQRMVDAALRGGAAVRRKAPTEMDAINKWQRATTRLFKNPSASKPVEALKSAFWSVPALLETVGKLPMGQAHALKNGATWDAIAAEMPRWDGLSESEQFKAMRQITRNMDARFGQVNWDNILTQRAWKDLVQFAFMAPGWTGGNLAALGEGVKDLATLPVRLAKGEPAMTRAMGGVVGTIVATGTLGMIYQYLHTGQWPDKLQDVFEPRNGGTNADGTAQRVSFPTMLRDWWAYTHHPLRTVANKTNPVLRSVVDLMRNSDYYGNQIRGTGWKAVGDSALYLLQQATPLSVRGMLQERNTGKTTAQAAEAFSGITPVSAEDTRSKAMQLLVDYDQAQMPASRTPAQAEKAKTNSQIRTLYRTTPDEARAKIVEGLKAGTISPLAAKKMQREANESVLVSRLQNKPADVALQAWEVMSDDEKTPQVRATIYKNLRTKLDSKGLSPQDRANLMNRAKADGLLK
jgi:hypothetical protein